jgi:hypothetical protein
MSFFEEAIHRLYQAFKPYSPMGMEHCDCGCIDPNDVALLYAAPLASLSPEALASYHGSALYTWGEIHHYKHYLPRVCELIARLDHKFLVDIDDLSAKLQYAKWQKWPQTEKEALLYFFTALWEHKVLHQKEMSVKALQSFVLLIGLKKCLSLWNITQTPEATENFVHFFFETGHSILHKGLSLSQQKYSQEFLHWIQSHTSLEKELEAFFFKAVDSDTRLAEKTSAVLQLLQSAPLLSSYS